MSANADKDVFTWAQFLGLRNVVGDESFEPGDLSVALNVDQTDALRLRRRKGYSTPVVAGNYHSLWSNGNVALVVSGTSLLEILPNYATRTVRTGLTAGARMWYASIGDRVFYSNMVETGVFQSGTSRTWGLTVPTLEPLAGVTGGSLPAGRYMYVLTYVRSDGQESGAQRAVTFDLPAVGGIAFSGIPVSSDPGVTSKRLYITPVNGDILYMLMVLPNSATSAVYDVERVGTKVLDTQFLNAPPKGNHLAAFAGRMLMVLGNRLLYSEAYAPELFDLRKGVSFTAPITLVAPVEDGVYCGTESEIVWLPGKNPAEWQYQPRANYGAIPGTLAYGPAKDVAEGAQGLAAFVATVRGICVGLNGGQFVNLTNDRFNYPVMDEGAGVVRDNGGSIQYVATLRGTERAGNTAF